jgi:hypothetical protein
MPYALFAFGAVFLGVLIPVSIKRAHRTKEKIYYVGSLESGLVLLAWISVFFLQFTLFILFMVAAFIIGVVSYPELENMLCAKPRNSSEKQMLRNHLKHENCFYGRAGINSRSNGASQKPWACTLDFALE